MKTTWQISDSESIFYSVFINIKIAGKIVGNVTILSEKVVLFTPFETALLRFSGKKITVYFMNKNENQ
jgi:hypothetical protein